jgi:hypothetical protein
LTLIIHKSEISLPQALLRASLQNEYDHEY